MIDSLAVFMSVIGFLAYASQEVPMGWEEDDLELLELRELKRTSKKSYKSSSYKTYYYNSYYNSYSQNNTCNSEYEDCSTETWVAIVIVVIITLVVLGFCIYKCSKLYKKRQLKSAMVSTEKALDNMNKEYEKNRKKEQKKRE